MKKIILFILIFSNFYIILNSSEILDDLNNNFNKALYYYDCHNFEKVLFYSAKTDSIRNQIYSKNNPNILALEYNLMASFLVKGYCNINLKNYSKAKKMFLDCYNFIPKSEMNSKHIHPFRAKMGAFLCDLLISNNNNIIKLNYFLKNNFNEIKNDDYSALSLSYQYYLNDDKNKAFEIANYLDPDNRGFYYFNLIGMYYYLENNLTEAKKYFELELLEAKQFLDISPRKNFGIAKAYLWLCLVNFKSKEFDALKINFEKMKEEQSRINDMYDQKIDVDRIIYPLWHTAPPDLVFQDLHDMLSFLENPKIK